MDAPPTQAHSDTDTDKLCAALEAHGEQLVEELQLLGDMPQVRLVPSSVFDSAKPQGSKAQLRGVRCKLTCCKKEADRPEVQRVQGTR